LADLHSKQNEVFHLTSQYDQDKAKLEDQDLKLKEYEN